MIEKYYTLNEVSELMHVTTRQLYNQIKSGALPATKVFNKWVVSESTLKALIEEGKNTKDE